MADEYGTRSVESFTTPPGTSRETPGDRCCLVDCQIWEGGLQSGLQASMVRVVLEKTGLKRHVDLAFQIEPRRRRKVTV